LGGKLRMFSFTKMEIQDKFSSVISNSICSNFLGKIFLALDEKENPKKLEINEDELTE
jgi:hypothetical protein